MVIGMMCYSLYVWHGVILMGVIMRLGLNSNGATLTSFCIALSAIAFLSYRYIEFGHIENGKSLFRL
jgi:peptidoglycan/LPS O-acetylase OafA/YrhL